MTTATFPATRARAAVVAGVIALALAAGMLITYKAGAAMKAYARAQASGTLRVKPEWIASAELAEWARPLAGTANYFSWVVIALGFGVLIGALVRAFVPDRWLAASVTAPGLAGPLLAAVAGAPLMLCSCCVAPIFHGVYERTRRLGPALALMLASPALNPAALALTFLLFPLDLAVGRLVASAVLVLLATAVLGRLFPDRRTPQECAILAVEPTWGGAGRAFLTSLGWVAWRTLPAIALGVVISAVIIGALPIPRVAAGTGGGVLAVLVAAAIAVPLALPTFGEIPIALALTAAGAPDGAVLAVLIAGPSINLPSLFTLGRSVSARAALATGAAVFLVAAGGGLLAGV